MSLECFPLIVSVCVSVFSSDDCVLSVSVIFCFVCCFCASASCLHSCLRFCFCLCLYNYSSLSPCIPPSLPPPAAPPLSLFLALLLSLSLSLSHSLHVCVCVCTCFQVLFMFVCLCFGVSLCLLCIQLRVCLFLLFNPNSGSVCPFGMVVVGPVKCAAKGCVQFAQEQHGPCKNIFLPKRASLNCTCVKFLSVSVPSRHVFGSNLQLFMLCPHHLNAVCVVFMLFCMIWCYLS